jgi:hypothetical protein
VPYIPILGALTSLLQMAMLPWETWVRLIVWMGVGLLIYRFYSLKHAKPFSQRRAMLLGQGSTTTETPHGRSGQGHGQALGGVELSAAGSAAGRGEAQSSRLPAGDEADWSIPPVRKPAMVGGHARFGASGDADTPGSSDGLADVDEGEDGVVAVIPRAGMRPLHPQQPARQSRGAAAAAADGRHRTTHRPAALQRSETGELPTAASGASAGHSHPTESGTAPAPMSSPQAAGHSASRIGAARAGVASMSLFAAQSNIQLLPQTSPLAGTASAGLAASRSTTSTGADGVSEWEQAAGALPSDSSASVRQRRPSFADTVGSLVSNVTQRGRSGSQAQTNAERTHAAIAAASETVATFGDESWLQHSAAPAATSAAGVHARAVSGTAVTSVTTNPFEAEEAVGLADSHHDPAAVEWR